MTSASESAPAQAKTRRRLQGVVVSSAADKTIKVRVERRVKHRLYGKVLRRTAVIWRTIRTTLAATATKS